MTEIYNKKTLNHAYPIISCLKSFNFCLKGEKSSVPFFSIYSFFYKCTATMTMMMVMGSRRVRFCVFLSPPFSPIPQGFVGDNPLGDQVGATRRQRGEISLLCIHCFISQPVFITTCTDMGLFTQAHRDVRTHTHTHTHTRM